MICKLCGEDKLSKEFPHEHLTEECIEHPILHCLKVSIDTKHDPNCYTGCNQKNGNRTLECSSAFII